ncbi:OsmC family protein [Ponticoccus alexandrii]|uniref:OsmC family peroxiredoxin n=1 Tax=Ponticoccus alexandrii TaxID=1943633 RepID=A0ABX7FAP4_9RHOB|nr:OsmC family protein [Ponticoccus alexandrii]QRF66773.1 OsmC family peroxiredoxin [Ponticoccus alexandrii]
MITKAGSAKWMGGLKDGKGTVSTESTALKDQPYGFNTRFEGQAGTNPEELIAAAHASCFSMALSMILGQSDLTPEEISTTAKVSMDKDGDGFAVTKSHLTVAAKVPGASEYDFMNAAEAAKAGCPISKVLNCEITMQATLA